jgi:hypothetical protein
LKNISLNKVDDDVLFPDARDWNRGLKLSASTQ